MTDPVVRRLPPLPVYGSPRQADPLVEFAGLPKWHQPSGGNLPFVMADEGPICTDLQSGIVTWTPGPQPATAEQAAEIIRLLTDIRDQLARAFGPGR